MTLKQSDRHNMEKQKKSELMKVARIIALISVIAVLFEKAAMWRTYRNNSKARQDTVSPVSLNDGIEVRMRKIAEVAIGTIDPESRMPFNFSPESLQKVDEILGQLPQMVSTTNRDEELSYACLAWGAYVGEVIRRHHKNGTWSEAVDDAGHGVYPLLVGQQTIYPCQWTIERVEKGPTASVWRKYQALSLQQ